MNGLGRKVGFLSITAVIATALLGASYSLWFEDVKLTAEVRTGELDATIGCASLDENEPDSLSEVIEPAASYPGGGKQVANGEGGPIGQNLDSHNYLITITNAYPGYLADCELHLVNSGTVPWHIEVEQIMVMVGDDTILTGECDDPNPFSQGDCWAGDISPSDPEGDPIYVQFKDLRGCQVHEANEEIGSVFIGVNQSALEGTEYVVMLKFRVQQWNESNWVDCGDLKDGLDIPDLPQEG